MHFKKSLDNVLSFNNELSKNENSVGLRPQSVRTLRNQFQDWLEELAFVKPGIPISHLLKKIIQIYSGTSQHGYG